MWPQGCEALSMPKHPARNGRLMIWCRTDQKNAKARRIANCAPEYP